MKCEGFIKKMSLEEKASLMSGANFWNTKSVERVNIPSMMLTDGPHGLRKQGGKADNLGLNKSIPATCYPTASALANSWDEELLEKLRDHNAEATRSGGVVIACGMSKYRNDDSAAAVFERADRDMYENKKLLKSGNRNR